MPSSNDLFVVEEGDGAVKDYQFGNKTMTHKVRMTFYPSWIRGASTSKKTNATKFCPTCGTAVMGQRHVEGPSIGVNVRKKAYLSDEASNQKM